MKIRLDKTIVATAVFGGLFLGDAWSQGDDVWENVILDTRIRYEAVDQESTGDADALTLRARVGWESDSYEGFSFLVEGDFSEPVDDDSYDAYPGAQGAVGKALIADGPTRELNRAQVAYSGDNGFSSVVGRQRIILGNARFVGNVGWRQNEQTFDAATFVYQPREEYEFTYGYVDGVNRIFGSEAVVAAQETLQTEAHVFNAIFDIDEQTELGVYAYLLGVDTLPSASSDTFGAYYLGSGELDNGVQLTTRLELAQQLDNSHSSAGSDFELSYCLAEFIAKKNAMSGSIGYECLEGNGFRGFSTPLATLHAFNGWADVFLATPVNGLVDVYASLGYTFSKEASGKLVYHNFESESGSIRYGDEYDAVFSWKLNDRNKLTAKYAFYNGAGGAPGALKLDRTKFWLQLDSSY